MGRPTDEREQGMMPPTGARRRALRAVLGALAGGGLTAAGLGAPLATEALASNIGGVPTTPEVTAPELPGEATTPSTSTTTTPVPSTPSTGTTGTTTTPQPAAPKPEAPSVVLQRRQKT